jgi:hypothetical protein
MRNAHSMTWIMAIKLKKVENETEILYELESGEEHLKT